MKTQKLTNTLSLKKMNRIESVSEKRNNNVLIAISSIIMMVIVCNPIFGQNASVQELATQVENSKIVSYKKAVSVSGNVSDADGPLPGVTILLKGTISGTSTNFKGNFTFPKELNTGDVLVFSYLGFKTEEVVIKEDTPFIKLTMVMDDIDIFESLQTNKPYKSKRKH